MIKNTKELFRWPNLKHFKQGYCNINIVTNNLSEWMCGHHFGLIYEQTDLA